MSSLGLWSGDPTAGWPRALALATDAVFLFTVDLSIAFAITAVTLMLFPTRAIWFGVLHCIARSILIVYPEASAFIAMVACALMVTAGVILHHAGGSTALLGLGPLPPEISSRTIASCCPGRGGRSASFDQRPMAARSQKGHSAQRGRAARS